MGISIGGKDWNELLEEVARAGSVWHTGQGMPDNYLGKIHDHYLAVDTGDIYKKTNDSDWEYQGNIKGPEGPPGSAMVAYTHEQIAPAQTWTIFHGLGRFPGVTVVDSANNVVIGDVQYVSEDEIKIAFTAAFAGKVYLS